jgi:hypothetical protein
MESTKTQSKKIIDKSNGIIYLIQPAELISTNRFKIGCSCQGNLNRCITGYKKGSRYIYIIECKNPFELETQLINHFNKTFKLIAGIEYFEGDEQEIKYNFLNIVNNYENIFINDLSPRNTLNTINMCNKATQVITNQETRIIKKMISPIWGLITDYLYELDFQEKTTFIKKPTELHKDLNSYCRQRGLNNPEDTNSIKTKLLDIDPKCFKRTRVPTLDGKEKREEQYVLEIAKIREYMKAKNLEDTTVDA